MYGSNFMLTACSSAYRVNLQRLNEFRVSPYIMKGIYRPCLSLYAAVLQITQELSEVLGQ